jgi:hypothetical protein
MDFKWSNRNWTYKTITNTPATISIKDIMGVLHNLQRLEHTQATLSLGVEIVPDGKMKKQLETLHRSSVLWVDQMKQGKLSRSDAWLVFSATIWKSITYLLPAMCLTKKECEMIMSPAINQALVLMGFCRHFPRAVVFAPQKYLGLGIQHIHTMQEILRLQDIINHTLKATFTGQLHRASLEHLIIEVGVGTTVLEQPNISLSPLVTPSLIKHTWKFLDEHGMTL